MVTAEILQKGLFDNMKNPLIKRLPRELKNDFGKYLVIFVFMIAAIGFVSGFLVADDSLKKTYDESFEKYNVEDGHFILSKAINKNFKDNLEKDMSIKVYDNIYIDSDSGKDHTVRIYKTRVDINGADLIKGDFPKSNNDIAIDRLYAENNNIEVGDTIIIREKEYNVCGYVALSDYSSLFKNNTDMMFDAHKFSVAMVTEQAFEEFDKDFLKYCYAWKYNDGNLNENQRIDKSNNIMEYLAGKTELTDFVKRENNQAINFAGDDMGKDKVMFIVLLYIVMAVLAFVFAVIVSNTIEQEANVIGTLRASGYTKAEILRHYLAMPVIVTLISAVIGNILGYTYFKYIMADLYRGSYSLPDYRTVWSAEAFILTTVSPIIIMLVVNIIMIVRKLSLSPLKFLRRDLKKKQRKKAVRLPKWSFMTRFRTRIIMQNIPTYIVLFVGILLANFLLFFGLCFSPLLDNFKDEVKNSMFAEHQYVLKSPVETINENAEKYSVTSLIYGKYDEEVSVYGVEENSKYIDNIYLPQNEKKAVISNAYADKFGIRKGDEIILKDKYSKDDYTFIVDGVYKYPSTIAIFINRANFNAVFDKDEDYYIGYLSNEKLEDIDTGFISTEIVQHDLTLMSDQLEDSMGNVFMMFGGFSALLFVMMIYLLSKIVLEKNAASISMTKILGYSNGEVGKLYIVSTAFVTLISIILSLPICYYGVWAIWKPMLQSFTGWLPYYISPYIYPKMIISGVVCFALVSLLNFRKIKKIPMDEALKNAE